MKASQVWKLTPEEIEARIDNAYAELFNLRFQFASGQMRNSARLGQMRRDIARLHTILRAKKQQAQPPTRPSTPGVR